MNKYNSHDKPIYIMPMNVSGLFIYHVLKREGIIAKGFLDNDVSKQHLTYDGKEILSPQNAYELHPNALVIICTLRFEKMMREQLDAIGFSCAESCSHILDGLDSRDALSDILVGELQEIIPNILSRISCANSVLDSLHVPKESRGKDALIIPQLTLSVTRCCTLKCKHCSNLMQYYANPSNVDINQIFKSLDAFLKNVDYVGTFAIIGGEPLVYNKLPKVVERVAQFNNVGTFRIVTNGTVLPSDELLKTAKKHGVTIEISNYGSLSSHMDELVQLLQNNHVKYYVTDLMEWFDCCKIIDGTNRTDDELQSAYENCVFKCPILLEDRFFFCPFLAHATDLKALPFDETNCVNLSNPELCKDTIRQYVNRKKHFDGCRSCSGYYGFFGDKLPVAEQIKTPLPYKKMI